MQTDIVFQLIGRQVYSGAYFRKFISNFVVLGKFLTSADAALRPAVLL